MKPVFPTLTQSVLTTLVAFVSLTILAVFVVTSDETTTSREVRVITAQTEEAQLPSQETSEEPFEQTGTAMPTATTSTNTSPTIEEPVREEEAVTTSTESEEAPSTTNASMPISFYASAPMSLDTVNEATVPALVNILCGTKPNSGVRGATGSGIIIDERGVILTNAHVAQYVLLADHSHVQSQCVVRTGSPARAKHTVSVLAFPEPWLQKHAHDINAELAKGTGEHDWALLYISGTTDNSTKPDVFPFVELDTREGVATTNDPVLLASYPAGFLGSIALQRDLWPVSTTVTIQKVYTFSESLIDLLALGGNIVAQGGSSGGAVMNPWGKLVGIIVTSSLGDTTDDRDLRAVTLSHINRSVQAQTGLTIQEFLAQGAFEATAEQFKAQKAEHFLEYFPL